MDAEAWCESCRFFEKFHDEQIGECRRHAPRPPVQFELLTSARKANYPITETDDWCGEYEFGEPRHPKKLTR